MNSIIRDHYPIFEYYQAMRNQLMKILTDADLSFTPGGSNRPLGELCKEIGEVQTSYIQSFRTFEQSFDYRNEDVELLKSVNKLRDWYVVLDQELKEVIFSLSEEDLQREINRGFTVKPFVQLEVYKEALLIFYGKVTVYLLAMGKTPPQQWQEWLGA